jgi:hypothetical protein
MHIIGVVSSWGLRPLTAKGWGASGGATMDCQSARRPNGGDDDELFNLLYKCRAFRALCRAFCALCRQHVVNMTTCACIVVFDCFQ